MGSLSVIEFVHGAMIFLCHWRRQASLKKSAFKESGHTKTKANAGNLLIILLGNSFSNYRLAECSLEQLFLKGGSHPSTGPRKQNAG